MSTIAKGPALSYARGDTAPFTMRFNDENGNFDWTGWTSVQLTVDTLEDPPDNTTNQITFIGTIDADPLSGLVAFRPPDQATSDNLTPSDGLYYDVQGINPDTQKSTLLKGGDFTILQDINKS